MSDYLRQLCARAAYAAECQAQRWPLSARTTVFEHLMVKWYAWVRRSLAEHAYVSARR